MDLLERDEVASSRLARYGGTAFPNTRENMVRMNQFRTGYVNSGAEPAPLDGHVYR